MKLSQALKEYCPQVTVQNLPLFEQFNNKQISINENGIADDFDSTKDVIISLILKHNSSLKLLVDQENSHPNKWKVIYDYFPRYTCGKQLVEKAGIRCYTCSKNPRNTQCIDCFDAKRHEGHNYIVVRGVDGFCDCGLANIMKTQGFCEKHKGEPLNCNYFLDFSADINFDNLLAIFWFLSHQLFRLSRSIIQKQEKQRLFGLVFYQITDLFKTITNNGKVEAFCHCLSRVLIFWPVYTNTTIQNIKEFQDPKIFAQIILDDQLLKKIVSDPQYFITSHCQLLFYFTIINSFIQNQEQATQVRSLDDFISLKLIVEPFVAVNLAYSQHLRNQIIWMHVFKPQFNPYFVQKNEKMLLSKYLPLKDSSHYIQWADIVNQTHCNIQFDKFMFDFSSFNELSAEVIASFQFIHQNEHKPETSFTHNAFLAELCFGGLQLLIQNSHEVQYVNNQKLTVLYRQVNSTIITLINKFHDSSMILTTFSIENQLQTLRIVQQYVEITSRLRSFYSLLTNSSVFDKFFSCQLYQVPLFLSVYPTAVLTIPRRVVRDCLPDDENMSKLYLNLLIICQQNNQNMLFQFLKFSKMANQSQIKVIVRLCLFCVFFRVFQDQTFTVPQFPHLYRAGFGLHQARPVISEGEIASDDMEFQHQISNTYVSFLAYFWTVVSDVDFDFLIINSSPTPQTLQLHYAILLNQATDLIVTKSMFDAQMFLRLGQKMHIPLLTCFGYSVNRGICQLQQNLILVQQLLVKIQSEKFENYTVNDAIKQLLIQFGLYDHKSDKISIQHSDQIQQTKLLADLVKWCTLISCQDIQINSTDDIVSNEVLGLFVQQNGNITPFSFHQAFKRRIYYNYESLESLLNSYFDKQTFDYKKSIVYQTQQNIDKFELNLKGFNKISIFNPVFSDIPHFPQFILDQCAKLNVKLETELEVQELQITKTIFTSVLFQQIVTCLIAQLLKSEDNLKFVTQNELVLLIVSMKLVLKHNVIPDQSLKDSIFKLYQEQSFSRQFFQLNTQYYDYFITNVFNLIDQGSSKGSSNSIKPKFDAKSKLSNLKNKISIQQDQKNVKIDKVLQEYHVHENCDVSIQNLNNDYVQLIYNTVDSLYLQCSICNAVNSQLCSVILLQPSRNYLQEYAKDVKNELGIKWFPANQSVISTPYSHLMLQNAQQQLDILSYSFLINLKCTITVHSCGHSYHKNCYIEYSQKQAMLKQCAVCRGFVNSLIMPFQVNDINLMLYSILQTASHLNICFQQLNCDFQYDQRLDFTYLHIILPYIQKMKQMQIIVQENQNIFQLQIGLSGTMDFFYSNPMVFISNQFVKVLGLLFCTAFNSLINVSQTLISSQIQTTFVQQQVNKQLDLVASLIFNAAYLFRLVTGKINNQFISLLKNQEKEWTLAVEQEQNPFVQAFNLLVLVSCYNLVEVPKIRDEQLNKLVLFVNVLVQNSFSNETEVSEADYSQLQNLLKQKLNEQLTLSQIRDVERKMGRYLLIQTPSDLEKLSSIFQLDTNSRLAYLKFCQTAIDNQLSSKIRSILIQQQNMHQIFKQNVIESFVNYPIICSKCKILSIVCLSCLKTVCPCEGDERILINHRGICNPQPVYYIKDANLIIFMFSQRFNFVAAGPYLDQHNEDDPNFQKGLPMQLKEYLVQQLQDHLMCNLTYLMDPSKECMSGDGLFSLTRQLVALKQQKEMNAKK